MNTPVEYTDEEAKVLFSPWVMRTAWNKVLTWYSSGEWSDPAELLEWKADPWRHLAEVSSELSKGTYLPGAFPEIPYPKKGGYTRHFVMPSVRDQVAFTVFMVLLGPFLEARMPNVSMGNRLYRPRVRKEPLEQSEDTNDAGCKKRWFQAPFSLSHEQIYTGFASGYGLFRRVLQWLTNHYVLGGEAPHVNVQDPDEEDPDLLPYIDYLSKSGGQKPIELAYTKLDLKMAFPSVSRTKLRETMTLLLKDKIVCEKDLAKHCYTGYGRPEFPSLEHEKPKGFKHSIESYRYMNTDENLEHPWEYLKNNECCRIKLAAHLMHLLTLVDCSPWGVPSGWEDNVNSWFPCRECVNLGKEGNENGASANGKFHLDACLKLIENEDRMWVGPHGFAPLERGAFLHTCDSNEILNRNDGLPTGLAISGFLLNVALTPVDQRMVELADKTNNDGSGPLFYLRFADDVVILARDAEVLEKAICEFEEALRETTGGNLKLNVSKIKPQGVKTYVEKRSASFESSGDDEEGNSQSCAPKTNAVPQGDKADSLGDYLLPNDYLTRKNLELFTTEIVREMSGMSEETFGEKFGPYGIDRLEELMELASLEIEDFEVGADARLSFAVNRLARASWPKGPVLKEGEVVSAQAYVERIMLIAESALRRHPWRFKLWRAIIIIALRASAYFPMKGRETGGSLGFKWLCDHILPLIRWCSKDEKCDSYGYPPAGNATWEWDAAVFRKYPAARFSCEFAEKLETAQIHRCMERTSFHRTQFWQQWTYCISALQRVADGDDESTLGGWLTFFGAKDAKLLLEEFGDIGRFANVLYGDWTWKWDEEPFLWWWEAEALRNSCLTVLSGETFHEIHMKIINLPEGTKPPWADVPNYTVMNLVEGFFKSLGPPSAGTLRSLLDLEGIESYVISMMLGRSGCVAERIRKTFRRVMSYDLKSSSLAPHKVSDKEIPKLCSLWLPSYFARWFLEDRGCHSILKRKIMERLLPKPCDPTWALLGRLSLWDCLYSSDNHLKCEFRKPDDLQDVNGKWDESWNYFITLQDYASLRRLCMAHDLDVPLNLFKGWFNELEGSQGFNTGGICKKSLYHALYTLDDSYEEPKPSQAPALGLEWPLAWRILASVESSNKKDGMITPSTVCLNDDSFESLVNFRKSELVNGNERVLYELPWLPNSCDDGEGGRKGNEGNKDEEDKQAKECKSNTPELKAKVIPLGLDHPAPHPLFMSLPCATQDLQLAALFLWMLDGSERLLDQMFQLYPWTLPLSDRKDLRARFMLPYSLVVELAKCFGVKGYESEQWGFGYDSAETVLEKLLQDPWLRCVEFNMQGDWDLVEPPRENYGEGNGSTCAEELNLRLIQGVKMPDYSKWLPSGERPFFSVSRESMENVWEEMAQSLQQAYEESRVHVGNGEGQSKKRYPDMIIFPEWYVDRGRLRDLRQFSMQSGIGILCGLLPYELPRAVPVVRDVRKEGLRCLVNEAVLIVPGCETKRTKSRSGVEGYKFDMPTEVHQFSIRKCVPAVSEVGLLNGLEDVIPNSRWRFVSGSSEKRFMHPRWGNFAVTICADVLTPGKWEDLRGFIDHLFILVCNQDIDLYEQVTWAKGYELYANAITVNHGIYGGTTVWTPKHEYHKEVFRVRGGDKGLAISVTVPVRDLREARERQYECTLKEKQKYWVNQLERGKAPKQKEQVELDKVEENKCDELKHFKTPPPRVRYER